MKKIVLLLMLLMSVSVAQAWIKHCEEAVVILAAQHLNPEAKSVVDKYLGESYGDDVQYLYALEKAKKATHTDEIHYLHLDKNLKPKKMKKNDAYVEILNALKVVGAHESHLSEEVTNALRTVINLMCDMHTISNVRIDNIPHSKFDFEYKYAAAEVGKKKKDLNTANWSKTWRNYCNYPRGFSAKFRAYDFKVYMGNRYAEYSEGSLKAWAEDSGALAAKYLQLFQPDYTVSLTEHLMLDDVNYEQMVKAGCRLAALLNNTLK